MGIIKKTKLAQMKQDADRARKEGRKVLVMKLNYPWSDGGYSGEIVDWSLMIEAIESRGWVLDVFTGMNDRNRRADALCLFRPHPNR